MGFWRRTGHAFHAGLLATPFIGTGLAVTEAFFDSDDDEED